MAFSLWPQAATHKPQVSTSQISHPGPEGGRTAPCSDLRMERALVACSISSREFDALQTFLIWILWGNQPKQQCSMVVYNQRPKWSCTELQWSLLPSPYFHYETRPGDIAADQQCLDTGVNLCPPSKAAGAAVESPATPQPQLPSNFKVSEIVLLDDSFLETLSCSEDVLLTPLYSNFC